MCGASKEKDPHNDDDDDDECDEAEDDYPMDPLDRLCQKQTAFDNLPHFDFVPTGCGILRNLTFMGIFPTPRWLTDPTMPPDVKELFGGTPFFPLGHYKVVQVDMIDGSRQSHPLTIVVNDGVSGLNTGYWGGAFSRTKKTPACWARFETTDEHETSVKHQKPSSCFVEHDQLEFDDVRFEQGCVPGICQTQFEKIIGLAIDFILNHRSWNSLPIYLVEISDTSVRSERCRARRQISITSRRYRRFVLGR